MECPRCVLDPLDTGDMEGRRTDRGFACRYFFGYVGGTINNETDMKCTIRE